MKIIKFGKIYQAENGRMTLENFSFDPEGEEIDAGDEVATIIKVMPCIIEHMQNAVYRTVVNND